MPQYVYVLYCCEANGTGPGKCHYFFVQTHWDSTNGIPSTAKCVNPEHKNPGVFVSAQVA
jgi:hypothetical protein